MKKIKNSTECASASSSIDPRRKSLITVMARVLVRELHLAPPVAKKSKKNKGI